MSEQRGGWFESAVVAAVGWGLGALEKRVRNELRQQLRARLIRNLKLSAVQMAMLTAAALLAWLAAGALPWRLLASLMVWVVLAWNVVHFFAVFIPEWQDDRRRMAGWEGVLVKQILGISLRQELLTGDIARLFLTGVLVLLSKWVFVGNLELLRPWFELFGLR